MTKAFLLLFSAFIAFPIFAQHPSELQRTITQLLSEKKADVGLSILNLENGESVSLHGNQPYPM